MALPIIIFSVITLELDFLQLNLLYFKNIKNPYKSNAKSCTCCNHLICRSTIISSVNHRQFSVVNNSDLDWKSEDVIYVLTCSEGGWGMQYVGQTKRSLKTRFKEHLLKIKKAKKIDTFLYQHFRSTGHSWSSSKVLVQPVEKIIHKSNSTERFKNILRHELELNGLNVYKPLFHLNLMIIFTMKEIFLKCRISMLFPF